MPDYADWRALLARQANAPELVEARAHQQRLQRRAIILVDDLEAGDEWALYRKSVEAMLEADRAALAAKQQEILAPTAVGERLLTAKLEAADLAGRIAAREEDLAVPARWRASLAPEPA